MGATPRRPWRFHEEFMDIHVGLHPTGTLYLGKEVWEFLHVGVTDTGTTSVPIEIPPGTQMDAPIPGGIHVSITPAPNIWLDGASIDATDLQISILATAAPTATLQHSITFNARDFAMLIQFILSPA